MRMYRAVSCVILKAFRCVVEVLGHVQQPAVPNAEGEGRAILLLMGVSALLQQDSDIALGLLAVLVGEGWVRLTAGNAKDRHGNPMTVKLKGTVEPYFRNAE